MEESGLNLAKHEDVVGLARRVGGDVGSLDNLDTVTKEHIVAAINSLLNRIRLLELSPRSLFSNGEQGVWFNPSDLSTLFQDVTGTVPVTKDGDPVALIKDKSGNGNHATQSTAASRPIYRTDGILHWLEFDGVDDHMIINHMESTRGVNLISTISPSVDYFRIASKGAGITRLSEKGDWLLSPNELNNLRSFSGSGYNNVIDVVATNNIKANTYEYYSNANGQILAMNGIEESSSTPEYDTNDKPIYIGTDNLLQLPLKGKLFGIIMRFNSFTNEERQKAVSYLKTMAGVSL